MTINSLIAQSQEPNIKCKSTEYVDSGSYKIENDEIVYTPAGPALKSNVHLVKRGYYLNVRKCNVQIIQTKTGSVCEEFSNVIPKNRGILFSDSNIKSVNYNNGWIEYVQIVPNNNELILSFSTNWIVPSPPTSKSNQTIYLFNAISSMYSGVSNILQPVLQWGPSPAGGGNYWAICNWYVSSNNQYFHDSLIKVNSGDNLHGLVELISKSNDTAFNYVSSFAEIPGSELKVNNIHQLMYAYEALEAYNIQHCTDYPTDDKIKMSNIQITINPVTPSYLSYAWSDNGSDCGQHISIVNSSSTNGEVDIYFHRINTSILDATGYQKEEIHVYPNPVENLLHITTDKLISSCKIEVYNSLGNLIKTVINMNSGNEFDMDFQNYLPGLYFIKFYYNNKIFTSKIIRK